MIPFWSDQTDDTSTVFRDVIFVIMLTFVVLFLAALVHINPDGEKNKEISQPPGAVQVDIQWPSSIPADVDLWVKGPTDARPVGYSNRAGILFNLLRDDLGHTGDSTPLNYENAYTRGVEDGEYIINVHLYNARSSNLPIPVNVIVKYGKCETCSPEEIIVKTVHLEARGQEITVVRFTIDGGDVVETKTNYIPIKLRKGWD